MASSLLSSSSSSAAAIIDGLDNYKNLSLFLKNLYEEQFSSKFTAEERADISTSIYKVVNMIKGKMGEVDNLFEDMKIKAVGSSVDGTKLNDPDEFDFLFDITSLSNQTLNDQVIMKRVCPNNHGSCHILICCPSIIQHNVILSTIQDADRTTLTYLNPASLRSKFWNVFYTVCSELCKIHYNIKEKSGNLILFQNISSGLDLNADGPNVIICLKWVSNSGKEFGISVDVTPTVTLKNYTFQNINKEYLGISNTLIDHLVELLGNKCDLGVRITPVYSRHCESGPAPDRYEDKLCWRLSFSHVEIELVSRLHAMHKVCLVILKALKSKDVEKEIDAIGLRHILPNYLTPEKICMLHNLEEMSVLSTYMVKMIVLHHEFQCTTKTKYVGECMMKILDFMNDSISRRHLSNFLIPKKNCWSSLTKRTIQEVTPLLKIGLDKVRQTFQRIAEKDYYSYDETLKEYKKVKDFFNEHDGQ